ncbi:MAG: DUF6076 domain-containing protein [Eubacteriaceae bacterium]|jgi:hypothetical protein|nr:DUF6076 domain-containing protein [Eubacteriaceae bacterium]
MKSNYQKWLDSELIKRGINIDRPHICTIRIVKIQKNKQHDSVFIESFDFAGAAHFSSACDQMNYILGLDSDAENRNILPQFAEGIINAEPLLQTEKDELISVIDLFCKYPDCCKEDTLKYFLDQKRNNPLCRTSIENHYSLYNHLGEIIMPSESNDNLLYSIGAGQSKVLTWSTCYSLIDVIWATMQGIFLCGGTIKRCAHCNRYFVPNMRSDTKYCKRKSLQEGYTSLSCAEAAKKIAKAGKATSDIQTSYHRIQSKLYNRSKRAAGTKAGHLAQVKYEDFKSEYSKRKKEIKIAIDKQKREQLEYDLAEWLRTYEENNLYNAQQKGDK